MAKIMRQLSCRFFIAFFSLFGGAVSTEAATEPGLSSAATAKFESVWVSVREAYWSGDLNTAQRILEDTNSSFIAGPSTPDELALAEAQFQICEEQEDYACAVPAGRRIMNSYENFLKDAKSRDPTADDLEAFARWGYYIHKFLLIGSQGKKTPELEKAIDARYLDQPGELMRSVDTFVRRRLLLADLNLSLGDRAAARVAVEGALAALLSIDNPEDQPLLLLMQLIDVMDRLWALDDHQRISKFIKILTPTIEKTLPDPSLWMVRYRLLQSVAELEADKPGRAYSYAEKALDTLEQLKTHASLKSSLTDRVLSALWSSSILSGNKETAYATLNKLAEFWRLDTVRQTEKADYWQAFALMQNAIGRFMFGDRISKTDLKILKTIKAGSTKDPNTFGLADYIELAVFFQESLNNYSVDVTYRAALQFTSRIQQLARRDSFDHLPRSLVEFRIASALFLELLAKEGTRDKRIVDLSLVLSDIISRTGSDTESQLTALLSLAASDEERRVLRQGFHLVARKNDFETETLIALKDRIPSKNNNLQRNLTIDFSQHFIFGDYFIELDRWRDVIGKINPALNNQPVLAGGNSARKGLLSDDAALAFTKTPRGAIFIACLRADKPGMLVRSPESLNALVIHDRTIRLSLTASHAPNKTLDQQFPTSASVALYNALFSPVENCTQEAKNLILALPPPLLSTPAAALLKKMPETTRDGYDLQNAAWLIRSHAVRYVTSTLQLSYPARQVAQANHRNAFLGVGDPVLINAGTNSEANSTTVEYKLRGGRGIETLQELPETSLELRRVSESLNGQSTLLLREHGSESRLRREDLSAYRYIGFATHGVLREEIPGLIEPALILTPTDARSFSDGILTTSEISVLENRADLVSLTACNSASFDMAEFSVGLPSLASAFFVSGSKQVLATRWAINSDAGLAMGTQFFDNLRGQAESNAALSLREAQLAMIEGNQADSFSHPRFWSAFVIYGHTVNNDVSASEPSKLMIESIPLVNDAGEILGISIVPSTNEIVGVGIGKFNNQKKIFPRETVISTSDGITPTSTAVDGFFHKSIISFRTDNFITAISFYDNVLGSQSLSVAEINKYGKILKTVNLPLKDAFFNRVELQRLRDGSIVALVLWTSNDSTEAHTLTAIQLTEELSILRSTSTKTRVYVSNPFISAVDQNGRLLISLGAPNDQSPENNPSPGALVDTPLKSLATCATKASTIFVELDLKVFTFTVESNYRDIAITRLQTNDRQEIYAAGWEQSCIGVKRAILVRKFDNDLNAIFTDVSGFDTRAQDFFINKNGDFILAVQGEQALDAPSKNYSLDSDIALEVNEQGTINEKVKSSVAFAAVYVLSPNGKSKERMRLAYGDDAYVQGLITSDDSTAYLYGSNGALGAIWKVGLR
ncbi:MAG: CHAT domain-containing protein [Gammaproteobacteria bacterium]|nr:CHAT domain-containing protein [Gammaproteobacteria bacterium]